MTQLLKRSSVRLLLSFLALIALGTVLLALPISVEGAKERALSDVVFTAASAVCVTGLAVFDTGADFSRLGQGVILVLIQLGGLGVFTLSNWILLQFGRHRLPPSGRLLLEKSHGRLAHIDTRRLLGQLILFTLFWEGLGTLVLFIRFSHDLPWPTAMWYALFHSVSAFCNAGFTLFPDSLVRYHGDWTVNLTLTTLIIVGGLGFVVFADILDGPRSGRRRLTLHTRMVLTTTASLLAAGTALFLLFEWNNLTQVSFGEGILSSFFLSVTSRTAGFNTVDTAGLSNASLQLLIVFMVIGASPGSTGGGIKTTAAALLPSMLKSRLRNRSQVEVLGRTIPRDLVTRALAVTTSFVVLIVLATLLVELAEYRGGPPVDARGRFLEHVFEVTSAVGTVGLSTGITASLSVASEWVLVVCMIVGRLSPLFIAESLTVSRKELPYRLPEERVLVG